MRPFKKILAPTDFSETASQALRLAVELARKFEASVTLLHVYQLPAYPVSDLVVAWPNAYRDMLDRASSELDEAKAWLRKEDDAAGRAPVPIDTQISEGVPFREVINFATDNGYDLIVVGTHGRTGLDHVLLGSVAERIVRGASCPVLTVRASRPKIAAEKHATH